MTPLPLDVRRSLEILNTLKHQENIENIEESCGNIAPGR